MCGQLRTSAESCQHFACRLCLQYDDCVTSTSNEQFQQFRTVLYAFFVLAGNFRKKRIRQETKKNVPPKACACTVLKCFTFMELSIKACLTMTYNITIHLVICFKMAVIKLVNTLKPLFHCSQRSRNNNTDIRCQLSVQKSEPFEARVDEQSCNAKGVA